MRVLFSGVCSQTIEVKPAELCSFPDILIKRTYYVKMSEKRQVRMLLFCFLLL